jgi:hypothetical protein
LQALDFSGCFGGEGFAVDEEALRAIAFLYARGE